MLSVLKSKKLDKTNSIVSYDYAVINANMSSGRNKVLYHRGSILQRVGSNQYLTCSNTIFVVVLHTDIFSSSHILFPTQAIHCIKRIKTNSRRAFLMVIYCCVITAQHFRDKENNFNISRYCGPHTSSSETSGWSFCRLCY